MAKNTKPTHNIVSILKLNNDTYTIKDAWAWGEIDNIYDIIAGGVHFRGVLADGSIADGDPLKNLTVKDGASTKTIAIADQHDGDLFIYNAGTAENPKNLEFVVSDGHYSELGSTGKLGALAYANTATGSGSATVDVAGAITFNTFTPNVSKGTLSVTYGTGSISTSESPTAAAITYTSQTVNVGVEEASADITYSTATSDVATTTASAGIASTTTAAAVSNTTSAADVTNTTFSADVKTTETGVTVAGPSVSLTYSTGTFTALKTVAYDQGTSTLTISDGTSDAFAKSPSVESVGNITVTYDKTTSVSYAKTTGVSYAKTTNVSYAKTTGVTYDKATTVTYAKTTAVSYDKATTIAYDKTSAVTYDKVSASGTFLTTASLQGELTVTGAKPTATITNPTATITVTVLPNT